jgi:hypothetical protein
MNNFDYSYNKEVCMIFQNVEDPTTSSAIKKKQLKTMRKTEFFKYYRFFENEMNKTVQNNNREIYENWINFTKQHWIKYFSKEVPCNIVITNWESSSNNEAQFNSLFEALKKEQIMNFVIDEKKCGTTKNMISYIQKCVADQVGDISLENRFKHGGDHSDEEAKVVVSSDESSSWDNDYHESDDDLNEDHKLSISPLKRPTTDEYIPEIDNNDEIDQMYDHRRTTNSDLSKKLNHSQKQYKGEPIKNQINTEEDTANNHHHEYNDDPKVDTSATDKIGFSGIRKAIQKSNCKFPIIIVIQNIKTFPTENLNDLIYLVKKYRAKYKLKLCLMLGVQSNSYEDLMSKISITTSNFMIVKKFYFPSMKKILLEVIYRLLKSDKNIYLFGISFLQNIVENIQVYGLSLEKFKRIIHFLLAKWFCSNDYFYVNALIEKEVEKIDKEVLIDGNEENFYFHNLIQHLSKHNKQLENMAQHIETSREVLQSDEGYTDSDLKKKLWAFYSKKLKYFKAYEVLEEILVSKINNDSVEDTSVFKHWFLLNLFSTKDYKEKIELVRDELENIASHEAFLKEKVLPILATKTSKFLVDNYQALKSKVEEDIDILKDMHNKKQTKSISRSAKLTLAASKDSSIGKITRAKSEDDYKKILLEWMYEYVRHFLCLSFHAEEKRMFVLDWKNVSERIAPDIQGKMTYSLMHSGKILQDAFERIQVIKKDLPPLTEEERSQQVTKLEQDATRLMEGYKYYGKDIDVNEWFKTFKDIVKFSDEIEGKQLISTLGKMTAEQEIKVTERFLKALGDLKYIGYISESGRGTYIFKRNYFGKNKIDM